MLTEFDHPPSPLVSIIMPAYNAATTIEASLQSIASQTYPHYEVLVVDDGSTDTTISIVRRLAAEDGRIHLLQQAHLGVSAARNMALAAARGEFIALLDSDDLWYPEKLALQVTAFRSAKPGVALIYTWYDMIDLADRTLRIVRRRHSGHVLEAVCRNNFIGHSGTTMTRTAVLREIGGWDTSLRGCEDWKVHYLIAENHEFGLIERVLAGYRQYPGSATSNTDMMLKSFNSLCAEIAARHPDYQRALRLHSVDLLMNILLRGLSARSWRESAAIVGMMMKRHFAAASIVLMAEPVKMLIRRFDRRRGLTPATGPFPATPERG
jgi:glycosyltransferase involved in cell wall biosynthesis